MSNFSFENILGNESLIASIRAAVGHGRVSHAYIFDGPAGSGKKLTANTFAKLLQCENAGEASNTPCGKCSSCSAYESGNHPDVIFVRPSKTKALGVDDIREQVNSTVLVKPYKYAYKIYIIDKADEMSSAASNAILKTLEEPARYAVFLLLTSNAASFLPTILSRCVTLKLKPVPEPDVVELLVQRGVQRELAQICGTLSGGIVGKALEMSGSEEFDALRRDITGLLCNIKNMKYAELFVRSKAMESYRERFGQVLELMLLWYRDLLVFKQFGDKGRIAQQDIAEDILRSAHSHTLAEVFEKIRAVYSARIYLRQNTNFQLTADVLLMKLSA